MPLKILLLAAECVPFAKEGGLADVVGALPRALAARGHDVRVVIPRYWQIDRKKLGLTELPGTVPVPMGSRTTEYAGVWQGSLPESDVPVYFLEHEGFFGRSGLYDQENIPWPDNHRRFIFLSKAGLELCKLLDFRPDLVHVHDWHTGAVPLLLNAQYRTDPWVGNAASLLTVHNLQHQGAFPADETIDLLGCGWQWYNFLNLEHYGRANLLKAGLYHATLLSTVSRGYAREMQTPEYGWGLDSVVRQRRADLFGILNGVDYREWSPESDPLIPARFSADDLAGKQACKRALQREFGLPERDVPLFGLVSRLMKQKGIDILAAAMPRLLELDLQVVLLGAGEPWSHFYFGGLAAGYPKRFACRIGYDNPLAHRIEAGADFFLMPSAFEPCGLNQMYSLRYGTLPVVRATGGLDDSVDNFDERTGQGDGFKFHDLNPGALFDTVGWAVHTYYHRPEAMAGLIRQAMAKRFTWEEAARQYEQLAYLATLRRWGVPAFQKRFPEQPLPEIE